MAFQISSGHTLASATLSGGYTDQNGVFHPDLGIVLSGGLALRINVSAGGEMVISRGGVARATLVNGGTVAVTSSGLASNTSVYASLNGQSAGLLEVLRGGAASGVTIGSGGGMLVLSGGSASATNIQRGVSHALTVASGGRVYATVTSSNLTLSNGAMAISSTVVGAILDVALGGTASGVFATGALVSGSGTAPATFSSATIIDGGNVSGATIGLGAQLDVSTSRDAAFVTVDSGGVATASFGALIDFSLIQAGGVEVINVSGGVLSNVSAALGGEVAIGGLAVNGGLLVLSGGGQTYSASVVSIASAPDDTSACFAATVSSGGTIFVSSFGVAISSVVLPTGDQQVLVGGLASAARIDGGGQMLWSGGRAVDTEIRVGHELVSAGAHTTSTTAFSGGVEYIFSGGTALDLTAASGGSAVVSADGTVEGLTVSSGGYARLGGIVRNVVIDPGATVNVSGLVVGNHQTLVAAPLAAGSALSGSLISGLAAPTGIVVHNGGIAIAVAGGRASATNVSSGGGDAVSAGGTDIGTVVSNGGTESVFVSGLDSAARLQGGTEYVGTGGLARNTLIASGGRQVVQPNGKVVSASVVAGGSQSVSSAGIAAATTVGSGGQMSVLSGGTLISGTITGGGTMSLWAGAVDTTPITFVSHGGALVWRGSGHLSAALSGFVRGDTVDLAALSYTTTGTANLTTVLTVTEAGHADVLAFTPANSFAGQTFHLSSDGHGGTDVTLVPASGGIDQTVFSGQGRVD